MGSGPFFFGGGGFLSSPPSTTRPPGGNAPPSCFSRSCCLLISSPMPGGGAWPMPAPGKKRAVVRGGFRPACWRCSWRRFVGGGVFGGGAFLDSADRHQRSSARLKN